MCFICPSWLSFILYNPVRKILTDREKVMDESGIGPGSVVLEVGAGNGFFTEVLASRARKVYAVELQEGMVRKLQKRVGRFGERVEIIRADIAQADLGKAFADICLLYYSFHEVEGQAEAARVIAAALKPGGTLSIYEPAFEVGEDDMLNTVELFKARGLVTMNSADGTLTRFAKMRKG